MRYVKIGDAYFNPMRVERIKAAARNDGGKYTPIIKVCLPKKTFYFEPLDLGLEALTFDEGWAAMGTADAMAVMVVEALDEALA